MPPPFAIGWGWTASAPAAQSPGLWSARHGDCGTATARHFGGARPRGGVCRTRSAAYQADVAELVDRLSADESRGRLVAEGEDQEALLDSLLLCKFVRGCFAGFYAAGARIT